MRPEERIAVIEECATAVQTQMQPIIDDLKRGDVPAERKRALALAFNFYNSSMLAIMALKGKRV